MRKPTRTYLVRYLVPCVVLCLLAGFLPGSASATHLTKSGISGRNRPRNVRYDGAPRRAAPTLRVTTVARNLDIPWDVRPVGEGRLLFTQRDRARLTLVEADGDTRGVGFPSRRVWVSGETGLMGLAIDKDFAENRRIYTCQGWKLPRGRKDIRVIAWKLDPGLTAVGRPDVLVKGIPTVSGRHGGCRLLIARNGALLVGTGDAAVDQEPAEPALLRRQDVAPRPGDRPAVADQPLGTRGPAGSATSTPTATATCRVSPSARTGRCGRSSMAPTATTRSTSSAAVATSVGSPVAATTSPHR